MSVVAKRVKAFLIDYLVILVYAGLLFGVTLLVTKIFSLSLENISPAAGQLIGFITLTLPVILYFSLMENGSQAATLGKQKLGLQVVSTNLSKAGFTQLLLRNGLKFLPWELAHFFVFRLFHFSRKGIEAPDWVMAGLIAAQALALVYFLCLFFGDHRSIYEYLSATRVVRKEKNSLPITNTR